MKRLIILFAMFLTLITLGAETRTKNLDFIILLDKSLSMDTKIGDVKKFFSNQILDKELIPGDSLLIVLFYGKTEILIDTKINSQGDIDTVKTALLPVEGDGRFTDIGNAIDFTYNEVTTKRPKDAIRHFILLTDGRQEAPPGSPYQSTDFSITHPALNSAKNIARTGWKVQILGLGTDTEAENLANQLSTTSFIFTDSDSMAKINNLNFFEDLTLTQTPQITYLEGTNPILSLDLAGERMSGSREMVINQIRIPGAANDFIALNSPLRFTLPANQNYHIEIPLNMEAIPSITSLFGANDSQGELAFQFGGEISFSPGIIKADLHSFNITFFLIMDLLLLVGFIAWLFLGPRKRTLINSNLIDLRNEVITAIEPPRTHKFY